MMEVIASQYDDATEALVRAIEEARLENRKIFETLIGMFRGLMQEETTPSPGSREEGEATITDGLMKVSTTAKLPNSAQENQPEEGEAKITDVKLMEVPTTTKIPNSAQENLPAPASVMSKTGESRNAASATVTGETSDKEACRNALMPLSPLNSVSITPERSTLVQRTSGVLGHNAREFADSNRAPVSHSQGCNDPTISWGISIRRVQEFNIDSPRQNFEAIEASGKEDNWNRDELQPQLAKVNFISLPWDSILHKFQKWKMGVEMPVMIKDAETGVIEFWQNSMGILAFPSAYQVFVEMSRLLGMTIFDPGGNFGVLDCEIGEGKGVDKTLFHQLGYNLVDEVVLAGLKFTPGCLKLLLANIGRVDDRERLCVAQEGKGGLSVTLIFDPGGGSNGRECEVGGVRVIEAEIWSDKVDCNAIEGVQVVKQRWLGILVFDPGGVPNRSSIVMCFSNTVLHFVMSFCWAAS